MFLSKTKKARGIRRHLKQLSIFALFRRKWAKILYKIGKSMVVSVCQDTHQATQKSFLNSQKCAKFKRQLFGAAKSNIFRQYIIRQSRRQRCSLSMVLTYWVWINKLKVTKSGLFCLSVIYRNSHTYTDMLNHVLHMTCVNGLSLKYKMHRLDSD